MEHSFDVETAIAHGVEKAVILKNLSFWVLKNFANRKHIHEGLCWTYNSQSAFSELFPYMSQQKIGRHLREMESEGLIRSGNFNKAGYDRTKWYTVPSLFIVQNQTMDCPKLNVGLLKSEQPIPDSKPDNKPDVCRLDYDRIKEIFNTSLTKASNIVKLTEKRKKLVKKLFDDFELDYEKFVSYLTFLNDHPDAQWMFERRPKNDGTGQFWNAQTFEYFVSEKCFLNAKENMQ